MSKAFLVLLLAFAGLAVLAQQPFPSGEQTTIRHPGLMHAYVRVYTPRNYDSRIAYPIMFWYGDPERFPDTGPAEEAMRGHGFIAVGMSPRQGNDDKPNFSAQANWQACRAILNHIRRFLNVNQEKVFVGGVEAGAMLAAEMSWHVSASLAGVVVLRPGKLPQRAPLFDKELAVLVGTGELDYEFPHAQHAVRLFARLGGQVTYHEWRRPNQAYVMTGRLIDWLDLQVVKGTDRQADYVKTFIHVKRNEALAKSPWQKYLGLRRLAGDPRMQLAEPTLQAMLAETIEMTLKHIDIQENLRQGEAFRRLVKQEVELFAQGVSPGLIRELALQYRDFHKQHVDTPYAVRALVAEARVWSGYERLLHETWRLRDEELERMQKELQGLRWRQQQRAIVFSQEEEIRMHEIQDALAEAEGERNLLLLSLKKERQIIEPLMDVYYRRPLTNSPPYLVRGGPGTAVYYRRALKLREPFVLSPFGGLPN